MSLQASHIFNGTYTMTSPKGGHRTFDIKTAQKGPLQGKRIVSMLTGQDNQSDYTGFAFLYNEGIQVWNKFHWKGDWTKYAQMLWSLLTEGEQGEYHKLGYRLLCEGRCLICNRKLTTPESIQRGIGPECAQRGR